MSETRYFSACQDWLIEIDDLVSLTSLKTDPNGDATYLYTWATTDYNLAPYNAAVKGQPYTHLEASPLGSYRFPVSNYTRERPGAGRSRIQVVGSFGYCTATPPAIKEACLLISTRVFKRKDLIFGVSGSSELGTLLAIAPLTKDGEIMMLLNTVKKRVIV